MDDFYRNTGVDYDKSNFIFGFYGIITPIGLFSRLVGKEFLNLKLNKTENTYWNHRRKHSLKKANYEKQF